MDHSAHPPQDPTPEQQDSRHAVFLYKLTVAALCLFIFAVSIVGLVFFRSILQPLFVAVFIGYLILPLHHWFLRRGMPSALAYLLIFLLIVGGLFGVGTLLYNSAVQVITDLPSYRQKVSEGAQQALVSFGVDEQKAAKFLQDGMPSVEGFGNFLKEALGSFVNFFSYLGVTFIYLLFLVAEKFTFPTRMHAAFGPGQGERVLRVVTDINLAISQYIGVKTFISFLAGVLSLGVLWAFQVEAAMTWALLIFLLNFIPYLGSLVGIALPILMAFVGLGLWQGIVVALLLIGIQEVLGIVVEPKMAGNKLGVSPLLILLSLAFWGVIWGIVGMILAVPLLVVAKIVLENIPETKPLAKLMSNM